jgi:hypothetical protein
MNVRIVKRPDGEAPEDVRGAWIGLSVPVLRHYSRIKRRGTGVLSGPRSWLAMWLKEVVGPLPRMRGYAVDTVAAIDLLENINPLAAAWWRKNTPHLFEPGGCLFFEEDCCVVESSAGVGEISK